MAAIFPISPQVEISTIVLKMTETAIPLSPRRRVCVLKAVLASITTISLVFLVYFTGMYVMGTADHITLHTDHTAATLTLKMLSTNKTTTKKTTRIKYTGHKNWKSPSHYCQHGDENPKLLDKERLIHLDLKGAPPTLSYYRKVFPLFRQMGATGLLLEYEDMFPYRDKLKLLALGYAYSESDLKQLIKLAQDSGLRTIIPLVQTFGHMEFVLKHDKFAHLREQADKSNAISPAFNESFKLIKDMIKQVSRFHQGGKYFHIGADEVYGIGSGRSEPLMKRMHLSSTKLFIWHVKRVVKYVRSLGYIPLMWDDMFRETTGVQLLKKSKLASLVEIVVWKYSPLPATELKASWLQKYEAVFPRAWIATGFKGGNSIDDYIVDVSDRVLNHINWMKFMKNYFSVGHGKMSLQGMILTGWQRYFHTAPLCELLPAGLPSLAFCLDILQVGCFRERSQERLSLDVLQCDAPIAVSLRSELKAPSVCDFPGYDVYRDIQMMYCANNGGMCSPSLRIHDISRFRQNMTKHLSSVYYQQTITEWMAAHT